MGSWNKFRRTWTFSQCLPIIFWNILREGNKKIILQDYLLFAFFVTSTRIRLEMLLFEVTWKMYLGIRLTLLFLRNKKKLLHNSFSIVFTQYFWNYVIKRDLTHWSSLHLKVRLPKQWCSAKVIKISIKINFELSQ